MFGESLRLIKVLTIIGIIPFYIISCKSINEVTFTARGCCPSCENSILESLQIDEVKSAKWNQYNEEINVKFDSDRISEDILQRLVSQAGYDTDLYRATDSVYLALPKCCHYRN
jgi:hypothetical protein